MLQSIDQRRVVPEEVETVHVYLTLMECRKTLLDLAERRDIAILVDQELSRWAPIRVNKGLFIHTALNLIDNAIKYSRDGTEVRIDGKRLPGGMSLSFVNRGIRIRDEDKERIFDRYWRSDDAKKHVQEGTGIGLSIVKVFVEFYGASEVRSVPVAGTRDYVTEFKLLIRDRG